jgi:hypothetical protein
MLVFTAFFAFPYWTLAVASLWVRSQAVIAISFASMILVGMWEWTLVILSDSSTKVLGLFAIPFWEVLVGTATLLVALIARQAIRFFVQPAR